MTRAARRALAAVLAILPLAACSTSSSGGDGFVAGDGSFTKVDPAKRVAAPVVAGKDLDGRDASTAAYAGKVVVINVWGSWCAPCRKEAPALAAAARNTAGRAQFLGLDTRDLDPAPARAFVRAFAIDYPSLYDPDGALLLKLGGQVPPNAIPTTLVLDAQGRVAARIVGETNAETLTALVTDIGNGK